MRRLTRRIVSSLRTWPRLRDWLEALLGLAAMAGLGLYAIHTGLGAYAPLPLGEAAKVAAIAFLVPAVGEELLFRSWLPRVTETARPLVWFLGAVAAFVFWHVLEGALMPRFTETFQRQDFLACATCLGVICATSRMRSGSIWPGVAVHWIVVAVWLTVFGGPVPIS